MGFGNFGQFLARTFVRQGHSVCATSRSDYSVVAAELGVDFAYPTQTVYLARSSGVPETPPQLKAGQQQEANEAEGREAARRIIESAGWQDHRPPPYHYRTAEESRHLDEEGHDAPSVKTKQNETRGSTDGGGE